MMKSPKKYAKAIADAGQYITKQDLDRLEAQKKQEIANTQAMISEKLKGALDPTQSDAYLKCLNK